MLLALSGSHHQIATLLIDSGANVEARDKVHPSLFILDRVMR